MFGECNWRITNLQELKDIYTKLDLLAMSTKELAEEAKMLIKKEYEIMDEINENSKKFVEGFRYKKPPNCS